MPPERIALIGFPGCGKTTVGQELARQLGYTWLDSDQAIETRSGLRIAEIFSTQGEARFRQLEGEWLQELHRLHQVVISTGGGLPCFFNHLDLLRQSAWTVFLESDLALSLQRLQKKGQDHTLFRHPPQIQEQIFTERQAFYRQADLRVNAHQSVAEIVADILRALP